MPNFVEAPDLDHVDRSPPINRISRLVRLPDGARPDRGCDRADRRDVLEGRSRRAVFQRSLHAIRLRTEVFENAMAGKSRCVARLHSKICTNREATEFSRQSDKVSDQLLIFEGRLKFISLQPGFVNRITPITPILPIPVRLLDTRFALKPRPSQRSTVIRCGRSLYLSMYAFSSRDILPTVSICVPGRIIPFACRSRPIGVPF